ncbi:MAG: phosphate permease [Planctomycetaceae bacterium]|nr:phosphate permease [Planctomycetaceae bacterium]
MQLLIALIASMLGFANGSNDNVKGVATLIGSRTLSVRTAMVFGTACTFVGSICAILLAGHLLKKFAGKDIVDPTIAGTGGFALTISLAAAGTVLLATFIGMPISTTHAIVGALVGVGLATQWINWAELWDGLLMPLLMSPPMAIVLAFGAYLLFRHLRRRLGVNHQTCVCVEREFVPVSVSADGSVMHQSTGVRLAEASVEECQQRYEGRVAGIDAQRVLNVSHVITAGALSFARGLNDTPKIAALMFAMGVMGRVPSLLVTGVAIAAGGMLAYRRVAQTMSFRITEMNDGQAFTANFITAGLVIIASKMGLPVSTTHVSCGSLFGIGIANRRAHWKVIGQVLAAWVTTLPVAALLAVVIWRCVLLIWR